VFEPEQTSFPLRGTASNYDNALLQHIESLWPASAVAEAGQ